MLVKTVGTANTVRKMAENVGSANKARRPLASHNRSREGGDQRASFIGDGSSLSDLRSKHADSGDSPISATSVRRSI